MSDTWKEWQRRPHIKFRTPAPADAPEVKGYRCYFRPEWLEWSVSASGVRVKALGPATRAASFPGDMAWNVEGGRLGDERPTWLLLPVDALAAATLAFKEIDNLIAPRDE